MTPKQWFLIREQNGQIEIISCIYETKEAASEAYGKLESTAGVSICETIYA